MNLGEYQAALEKRTAELARTYPDGVVRIVSTANEVKGSTAGRLSDVRVEVAARHLVEGTARLAAPEDEAR